MIFIPNKTFSWLVLASSLNLLFSELIYSFSLSTGLGHSICAQSQNFKETSQIQAALKSSSMESKSGYDSSSGSSCGWVVLKPNNRKAATSIVLPCSSVRGGGSISPKVINGEPTEPGEFPSLVSVYTYFSALPVNATYEIPARWDVLCSGVLVSEEWILTLEDCFRIARENNNKSRSRIYAGKFNHTPGTEPDTEQGPSEPLEFVDYPYEPPDDDPTGFLRFDYSLVKINPPFTLSDRVQLAHWPKADDGIPKDPVSVVGWGTRSRANYDGGPIPHEFIPHKKTMNVMDRQKCIKTVGENFNYTLGEEAFCLEDEKDSGPTVGDEVAYSIDAKGQQTFIAANIFWYFELDLPPVMTATSFLRKWAEEVVGKLA